MMPESILSALVSDLLSATLRVNTDVTLGLSSLPTRRNST
jgi:hypothetical protein